MPQIDDDADRLYSAENLMLPAKQEEMMAAQLTAVRHHNPPNGFLKSVAPSYRAKLDGAAMRAMGKKNFHGGSFHSAVSLLRCNCPPADARLAGGQSLACRLLLQKRGRTLFFTGACVQTHLVFGIDERPLCCVITAFQ